MEELHKDNFDEIVLGSKGLFLVDFWSEACEECQDIIPRIEELEKDFSGKARFGSLNIKGNRRLAIREKVLGLPTVLIYSDGEKAASFIREFSVDEVKAKLEELEELTAR
jgi:thioredoxin 1